MIGKQKNRCEYFIVTLNEEKNIRDCIESVKKFSKNGEIYILDGGSTDATREISLELDVKFLSFPNTSLSFRRGYAIQQSEAEYIVFVDADQRLVVNNDQNENTLLEYFQNEDMLAGVVFKKIISSVDKNYWERGFEMRHSIVSGGGQHVKVIGTPCIFRGRYGKLVGFNQKLTGSCDDTVFCDRLIDAGYYLKAVKETAIEKVRSSFSDTAKKAFWYGMGDAEYIRLYGRNAKRHLYHVFIRGPIIYPFKVAFKKPSLILFFILFGFIRASGLVYGVLDPKDLSKTSS
jgi:glycosyltransferase involved in cell wall biosynthesis